MPETTSTSRPLDELFARIDALSPEDRQRVASHAAGSGAASETTHEPADDIRRRFRASRAKYLEQLGDEHFSEEEWETAFGKARDRSEASGRLFRADENSPA